MPKSPVWLTPSQEDTLRGFLGEILDRISNEDLQEIYNQLIEQENQ
jgi:hypothetical protein